MVLAGYGEEEERERVGEVTVMVTVVRKEAK